MKAYRLRLAPPSQDGVSTALWDLDASGTAQIDATDDETTWLAYFPDGANDNQIADALTPLLLGAPERVDVPADDWVGEFKKHFRAFSVGSFRVVPAWDAHPRGERTLVVDPGQAFGTGTHESTRLCLLALEGLAAVKPLGRLADIGTGTGILAIASLRLKAPLVIATDSDEGALRNARHHAALNDVDLTFVRADGARALRPLSFDGIVANIAAPLLVSRAGELQEAVRPGGFLVLSGLLVSEADAVAAAYAGAVETGRLCEGEWACLVLDKQR